MMDEKDCGCVNPECKCDETGICTCDDCGCSCHKVDHSKDWKGLV